VSKNQVKRPRHLGEIERVDEETRVANLPPAAAAHEPPQLLLHGPSLPRRLLLEGAEGPKVSLSLNDVFDAGRTESADQLFLQVCDANVETQPFHIGPSEAGAEAGPLETAPELDLLCGVTETRKPEVQPLGPEPIQDPANGLRSPDRHDGDALGVEIPASASSERFQRGLVAEPFNEHDRTRVDSCVQHLSYTLE
jgi:hypothetical protein